jgi:hypothetical protein
MNDIYLFSVSCNEVLESVARQWVPWHESGYFHGHTRHFVLTAKTWYSVLRPRPETLEQVGRPYGDDG